MANNEQTFSDFSLYRGDGPGFRPVDFSSSYPEIFDDFKRLHMILAHRVTSRWMVRMTVADPLENYKPINLEPRPDPLFEERIGLIFFPNGDDYDLYGVTIEEHGLDESGIGIQMLLVRGAVEDRLR